MTNNLFGTDVLDKQLQTQRLTVNIVLLLGPSQGFPESEFFELLGVPVGDVGPYNCVYL